MVRKAGKGVAMERLTKIYKDGTHGMSSSYWNYEDDENIICPYCGKEYEPS